MRSGSTLPDGPCHRARGGLVSGGAVVERTVWFDVAESGAVGRTEGGKGADLIDQVGLDLIRRGVEVAATESLQVRVPRMRTNRDTACRRARHRFPHHDGVARVESAGHIGRGHQTQ